MKVVLPWLEQVKYWLIIMGKGVMWVPWGNVFADAMIWSKRTASPLIVTIISTCMSVSSVCCCCCCLFVLSTSKHLVKSVWYWSVVGISSHPLIAQYSPAPSLIESKSPLMNSGKKLSLSPSVILHRGWERDHYLQNILVSIYRKRLSDFSQQENLNLDSPSGRNWVLTYQMCRKGILPYTLERNAVY